MKNWYIVQTFSGFEQKVAETINKTVEKQELKDKIEDVVVPIHEVTEVKRGKRVQRKKKYFPSYILVKMEMNKELYHMIKNIQKVTGFLGSTGTGLPIKLFVFSLKTLQNSIIFIPRWPKAGPTGGAGFACPHLICNFTYPVISFAIFMIFLLGYILNQ